MEYNFYLYLIIIVTLGISLFLVPWLKGKGLWAVTLFAVNIAEQLFDYTYAGKDKFAWVDDILKQIAPKLTDLEREMLIEELVDRMNEILKDKEE